MKNSLALLMVLLATASLRAQKMVCCAPSATEAFAQLASDKDFVMSHREPLPFHFNSAEGNAIVFKAADGSDAYGWEIKSTTQTNNYLFVFHEWWGLNDYIKEEAETLWKDIGNVNVIAVDLYDRKVASTSEDAVKYVQAVTTERAQAIIKGAIAYAGPRAKIFTIGWCFGGGWSLQASILAGTQAAGCVMYYGMPEKDVDKLRALHADVLGLFANKDKGITPKIVDEFAENMNKAGKQLVIFRYDALHAFANPSNPGFDKTAKEDAYRHAIAFLKERMK
ncbi:MAG TPA: dienelactone hydrolase family protein [Puia sp.]|nr:dienelactone hydrolase family protein [Puia sp.]